MPGGWGIGDHSSNPPTPKMDFSYSACFSVPSTGSPRLLAPAGPPDPYGESPYCFKYVAPRIVSMVLCFVVIGALFTLAFSPPPSQDEEDEEDEEPGWVRGKKAARGALDPAVLSSFLVAPYAAVAGSGRVGRDCPVCLAEFGGGDAVRVLGKCGHGFHSGCIDPWLAGHATCPVCRSDLGAAAPVVVVVVAPGDR
ncbi:unnamed protein product [Musa acuminata subsp. malaccensis]|uniref:RING-type E3 ubiquitin transferase n=1 Tax=Musa acuminata subsp. malaccensis TaxID=214687 RepID=A0A804ILF1_MUSAM|nr:PREDICTED: E3 ubiquitin-protein ligase Os03g0188200-like [Musa acuminata subsp. malaccensis]CAG1841302.1 unnamed protein product [Musa acuminata subsp. malaccensis]